MLRRYKQQHDKTIKLACAPSEDSDQPGQPPSLIRVFAVRMKKLWVLIYPLSAQRRLLISLGGCPGWSESSLGAHSFCWFVMSWLILLRNRYFDCHLLYWNGQCCYQISRVVFEGLPCTGRHPGLLKVPLVPLGTHTSNQHSGRINKWSDELALQAIYICYVTNNECENLKYMMQRRIPPTATLFVILTLGFDIGYVKIYKDLPLQQPRCLLFWVWDLISDTFRHIKIYPSNSHVVCYFWLWDLISDAYSI